MIWRGLESILLKHLLKQVYLANPNSPSSKMTEVDIFQELGGEDVRQSIDRDLWHWIHQSIHTESCPSI